MIERINCWLNRGWLDLEGMDGGIEDGLYLKLREIYLKGLSTFNMTLPLVVMACSEGQRSACIPVQDIIAGLQLEQFNL